MTIPTNVSTRKLFKREWQVKKTGSDWLYPLVLFLIIATMFPLSVGTDKNLLIQLAIPIVWIATLLSMVVGVDGLFKTDFDNGTLAQIVVSGTSLPIWVLVKLLVHWLFSAGVVAILSVLAVPLFGLSVYEWFVLFVSVIVASPVLLGLLAIASSLTLSAKNAATLVPIIALPMQLPVLIFATGLGERAMMGMPFLPVLAILAAMSIFVIIATPFVVAYALKMAWQ